MSDAREVMVELKAQPGPWHIGPHYDPLDGWMYNGDAPGPLIEARVGDTLVVRLTNALPDPTSFALSGPAVRSQPGESPLLPQEPRSGQQQRMVQPHATLEYRFTLMHPGTSWYHPAGDVMQIERGLHGVLAVRHTPEPAEAERIIVLDDVCLGRRGATRRNVRDGCLGNVLLMNGRVQPQLVMPAATVEHWRVVNVANARPIRFSLGGARFRRRDHGSPGDGGRLRSTRCTETLLEPGETADLIVGPFEAGTRLYVQSPPPDERPASARLAAVFGTVLVGK